MTPILDRLNYGAPITPTSAEVSAAYSRVGALIWWQWTCLVRWLVQKQEVHEAPERMGDGDLDAARGIINAAIIGFATFLAVSWGISKWV